MKFTQHYAGSPVCAPARCVLITGKHPGHAFVRDNQEIGGWYSVPGQIPIPATETSHCLRAENRPATRPPRLASGAWAASARRAIR